MAQLNAGDVLAIVGGDVTRKPVLQCIGVKQMAGTAAAGGAAPAASAERYRLGVSDGQHWCSAMLATQLNGLVRGGSIDVGTMLRLDDYLVNTLNGRKLIIVLALEVLGHAPTVGQPVNADALAAGATAQVAVNNGNGSGAAKAVDDKPAAAAPAAAAAPGGAYGAPPPQQQQQQQNFQQQQQQQNFQQQQQQQPFSYGGNNGPVARADAPARVVPIASLNAYQNRWTIRGRVTMKSDVKHFQNARGEGKLFSFDLLDEHGGDIRCAGFGDAVDRWYDVVQPGSIISLSRASLKPKRPGPFNATSHDLEITLEPGSVLQVLPDVAEIPRQRYALRKIAALADAQPRTNVDVAGVVEAVAPATSITRRDGSEVRKRSVTLRDDSGAAVELTLWGSFADAALGDQLDGLVNGAASRPVLVGKALAVGDFGGGRTLSTAGSSVVTLDPQDVPEAVHLASWYSSGGADQPFHSLSGGGGGGMLGTGSARQDRRVLVGDVSDEAAGGRVAWVQVAGSVSFVKQDAAYYPACPGAFNGKACNKKMQEDPSVTGGWSCGRCGHVGAPAWRYMLSMTLADHTGSTWVTAFNDEAAALLGIDAGQLRALAGSAAHDAAFKPLLHADVVAKVKVFEEVYQDQARVKASVQRIAKVVDYAAEARAAMEMLSRVERGLAPTEPAAEPLAAAAAAALGGLVAGGGGWGGAAAPAPYGDGGYGGGAAAAGGAGGASGAVCYNCQQPGHYSRDCPTKQQGGGGGYGGGGGGQQGNFRGSGGQGGGGDGVCYKCQQPGHWARDCPGGGGGGGGVAYGGGGAGMGGYGGF